MTTPMSTQQEIDKLLSIAAKLTALSDAAVSNQKAVNDILGWLIQRVQALEAAIDAIQNKRGK